jgi:hypothetical protein
MRVKEKTDVLTCGARTVLVTSDGREWELGDKVGAELHERRLSKIYVLAWDDFYGEFVDFNLPAYTDETEAFANCARLNKSKRAYANDYIVKEMYLLKTIPL